MENKINIYELLKDCPKGMELDSPVWNNIVFEEIDKNDIVIYRKSRDAKVHLTQYGEVNTIDGKCVIFPKGKTTWEGFVSPCKFKDGDIIFIHTNALKHNLNNSWVSIFKEYRNNRCACYACLCLSDLDFYHDKWEDELLCELCEIEESRLATEEEKQKLFDAIKANGYKWNADTKTLEKLIEPKFKVGDRIEKFGYRYTIIEITDGYYLTLCGNKIRIDNQDGFILVPDKFDITTLKPFDKVLMRSSNAREWVATFYSHYSDNKFYGCGMCCDQCIPYEENQHLLGTTNDCDEYFKIWK